VAAEATERENRLQALAGALAAIRGGDLAPERVTRLSDLSREGARLFAAAWPAIPDETRAKLVRRCEQLAEERVDLNFARAMRVALDDPSPVVRQLAIGALWEDESRDLRERLRGLLATDPSPDVRAAAAAALERFAGRMAAGGAEDEAGARLRDELLAAAGDEAAPYAVRRRALEALGPYGAEPAVAAAIEAAFDSDDHGLQCSAVYAMGRSAQARWLPAILGQLEGDDPELRFEAARAAGALGAADAFPGLIEAAGDEDAEVRHMAIGALGQIGGRGAVRALERLAEDAEESDLELIEAAREEAATLLEPFPEPS
jgi:HEAT repeat protein